MTPKATAAIRRLIRWGSTYHLLRLASGSLMLALRTTSVAAPVLTTTVRFFAGWLLPGLLTSRAAYSIFQRTLP
jgi:hypothetical protein